jgi:hypothetical protein
MEDRAILQRRPPAGLLAGVAMEVVAKANDPDPPVPPVEW